MEVKGERGSECQETCKQESSTLCNSVDCSPPGSSVHGILQARILEWVAISFSRGSSQPRYRTHVSLIAGRRFNLSATSQITFEKHLLRGQPKAHVKLTYLVFL